MSAELGYFVHPLAVVDLPCEIGAGTRIWHFSHVMRGARIGRECVLGQNVHVGSGVVIGDRVKIQNNVSLYDGAVVEDEVFLGPSCVLTNVSNPRAAVERKAFFERTLLRRGCTIGANATVVCGRVVGRHAFVAAGAVVARDVDDYALVVGVPGRRVGWFSRHGHRLDVGAGQRDGILVCPESGWRYRLEDGAVTCLDCPDDAPMPADQRTGRLGYREGS